MSPWKINFYAPLVLLLGTVQACGPWFPSTIINDEDNLLVAPTAHFSDSLQSMALPPTEFHFVPAPTDQPLFEQTLAAERQELIAANLPPESIAIYLQARTAHQPLPADYAGVPWEYSCYHSAACALAEGHFATATEHWQRLLARPPANRKYKSVWAAYMLGRTASSTATARTYFQQTRQLAREGFADALGLAAASYGWEAKFCLASDDLTTAANLYLQQHASGDPTALNSLRFVATRVLSGDNATLNDFAADSRLREIITALLLSQREEAIAPQWVEGTPDIRTGATTRWLAALERANVSDTTSAPRLALAAYRAGQFTLTGRWLDLAAPDDDLTHWLRAKLALRAGDIDGATTHLAAVVHRASPTDSPLQSLRVPRGCEQPPLDGLNEVRAELGTLKLTRHDYTEALSLLLQANYWEDAAYVAERVLTIDELKTFVAHASDLPHADSLRHLLARRLVRLDRLPEARLAMPASLAPSVDHLQSLLTTGQDANLPPIARASALMDAARLLRASGMGLAGTELAPDFALKVGSFGGLTLDQRLKLPHYLRPTDDEQTRATLAVPASLPFLHYRYTAAELAWRAIELMPDNSTVTARALIEAGGWLKARDPQAANRFYQALVHRCGQTELGQAAAKQHWFPHYSL